MILYSNVKRVTCIIAPGHLSFKVKTNEPIHTTEVKQSTNVFRRENERVSMIQQRALTTPLCREEYTAIKIHYMNIDPYFVIELANDQRGLWTNVCLKKKKRAIDTASQPSQSAK